MHVWGASARTRRNAVAASLLQLHLSALQLGTRHQLSTHHCRHPAIKCRTCCTTFPRSPSHSTEWTQVSRPATRRCTWCFYTTAGLCLGRHPSCCCCGWMALVLALGRTSHTAYLPPPELQATWRCRAAGRRAASAGSWWVVRRSGGSSLGWQQLFCRQYCANGPWPGPESAAMQCATQAAE